MKLTTPLAFAMIFIACNSTKKETSDDVTINGMTKEQFIAHYRDSASGAMERQVFFDTVGVEEAPVKVLKSWLVKDEYSNYKDISITFKNVSDRAIEGIRFRWYGENVFGEPADMGSSIGPDGFGNGFMDKKIRPGQTMTLTWSILSRDGKKVVKAWPQEVVYTDGGKWESTHN